MTEVVKTEVGTFLIPDFVHDFGDPTPHSYSGSLSRHLAVEKILYQVQCWALQYDAVPCYAIFEAFLSFLFGLNCNFPRKDIARYLVWSLRKGYYDSVA